MKIFFIGTPRGEKRNSDKIHRVILKLGHEHTTDFMIRENFSNFYVVDDKAWAERYQLRLKEIAKSDVCIFEVSAYSISVGQLLQEAIRREKPTIALYCGEKKPQFLMGTALKEKRLQVCNYDLVNIEEVLSDALEIANELLTTRFTMLIPSNINKFLDDLNECEGLSRSEYIRDLILKDMERREN